MKMNPLGRTGMTVSELCLGTMTFGNQTAPEDGHAQIERALDAGINFMDTAEMYPVNPVRAETIGRTEEILGDWFAKTGRRNEWILERRLLCASESRQRGPEVLSSSEPAATDGKRQE